MSHFDAVTATPPRFVATAFTADSPMAVIESPSRRVWGIQCHPEVVHTEQGQAIIERFVVDLAGCRPTWTDASIIDTGIASVRAQVGSERVICGLLAASIRQSPPPSCIAPWGPSSRACSSTPD